MSKRSEALAVRLEAGAKALSEFAASLSDAEWQKPVTPDGRKAGIVIHHVADVYPVEIQLTEVLASGQPITGVIMQTIHDMNREHAKEHDTVTKEETLALLAKNSAFAAKAVRALSDAELDNAATVSLYDDAPLTCQFFLEDHPLRHSYHHLAVIKKALGR